MHTRDSSLRDVGSWVRLLSGLIGYGIAVVLMIQSRIGLGPWDAFHVGLHHLTGLSIGWASIAAGIAIVAGTMWMGLRPGPATILNMVLIGVFVDLLLPLTPAARGWGPALAYHVTGIALVGLSTGLYISAGLGKGPRDGLMVALSERTGWSVSRVRTGIEASVLALGWLMGGTIGIGTVLFTLTVGVATEWGMRLFGLLPTGGAAVSPDAVVGG